MWDACTHAGEQGAPRAGCGGAAETGAGNRVRMRPWAKRVPRQAQPRASSKASHRHAGVRASSKCAPGPSPVQDPVLRLSVPSRRVPRPPQRCPLPGPSCVVPERAERSECSLFHSFSAGPARGTRVFSARMPAQEQHEPEGLRRPRAPSACCQACKLAVLVDSAPFAFGWGRVPWRTLPGPRTQPRHHPPASPSRE